MNKLLMLLFLALGLWSAPTLMAAVPSTSTQTDFHPTQGYTIDFSFVKGEGNSFSLTLRGEGFKGCRLETWNAPQEGTRRNAMSFPQKADGSFRGTLMQEIKAEDQGKVTLRLIDLIDPTQEVWLILAPTTLLSSGRIRVTTSSSPASRSITPNMPVFCKSWCLRGCVQKFL